MHKRTHILSIRTFYTFYFYFYFFNPSSNNTSYFPQIKLICILLRFFNVNKHYIVINTTFLREYINLTMMYFNFFFCVHNFKFRWFARIINIMGGFS